MILESQEEDALRQAFFTATSASAASTSASVWAMMGSSSPKGRLIGCGAAWGVVERPAPSVEGLAKEALLIT